MKAPQPAAARPQRVWLTVAAIVIAGTLAYSNSLSGPLVFDDTAAIANNPTIRHPQTLRELLSPPAEFPVAGRPLVNLTFALNYAIGGTDPRGYHVVNLVVHLLCALVLFGLMRRTLELPRVPGSLRAQSVGVALTVAVLWTVHPLNTEVVDYLSQRTESMMALCYLLTMYCSLRAVEEREGTRWMVAAAVACAAGMACKESMVTAPVVVVLHDAVFLFGSVGAAWRRRWRFYGSLAMSWLLLGMLLLSHPRGWSNGFESALVSPWTYLMNQAVVVTHYLRLAIWPDSLVLLYGWVRPLALGDVWPYVVFLGLLMLVTLVAFFRRPQLAFLGTFAFITLAPASSIVPVAVEVGAERRMYVPLMGLVALVVVGAALLWTRTTQQRVDRPSKRSARVGSVMSTIVVVLVATALGACTIVRNREYASAVTLARTSVTRWPSPGAHYLLAVELSTAGEYEEALQQFREAVPGPAPAHYGLGVELFRAGRMDEAIEQLREFIAEEPRHANTEVTPARMVMARAFARTERWSDAVAQCQQILAENPNDADARELLAIAFARQQMFAAAIPQYRALLVVRPTDTSAWANLGIAFISTGQIADAVAAFRRAVELQPGEGGLRVNLVRSLLAHGEIEAAATEAKVALDLSPDSPATHEVSGLVNLSQGKRDMGIRELERSLQLDPHYEPALQALRQLSGRGGR